MIVNNIPRIMLAAVSSGSGKTTVTCGIMQALMNRNKKVTAFKCGPDYIDPMFHSQVIGAKSRNLDLFLMDENTVKYLLCKNGAGSDISVMEGVMGYYDGVGGNQNSRASAYHLAIVTHSPVILIVNCDGMYASIAALIKGFMTYRSDSNIKGVILNRLHDSIYPEMKRLIEKELDIKVIGYLPRMKDYSLESRHLGLVTAGEVEHLKEKLDKIAAQIESSMDLDLLENIANDAPTITCEPVVLPKINTPVKIGVALDKAFCFYYQDSLELLCDMGAQLVTFSPMSDKALPDGISGLFLGGGYPEIYAEILSKNTVFMDDLRNKINNGLPCFAECGGFMYLHEIMQDENKKPYKMAGIIRGESCRTDRLVRFGYAALTAQKDNILCKKGESINAHEFHYWDSTQNGDAFIANKPEKKQQWQCIVAEKNLFAGYPHMHFYSNKNFAQNFLSACTDYKTKIQAQD